jgi:hypothetical protein
MLFLLQCLECGNCVDGAFQIMDVVEHQSAQRLEFLQRSQIMQNPFRQVKCVQAGKLRENSKHEGRFCLILNVVSVSPISVMKILYR